MKREDVLEGPARCTSWPECEGVAGREGVLARCTSLPECEGVVGCTCPVECECIAGDFAGGKDMECEGVAGLRCDGNTCELIGN